MSNNSSNTCIIKNKSIASLNEVYKLIIRGSDKIDLPELAEEFISIHTPVKGVTIITVRYFGLLNFNPHSRKGSDPKLFLTYSSRFISIHTPVKGVTWRWYINITDRYNFNPHSRKGSDVFNEVTERL